MALTKEQAISQYGTEAYTAWGEAEAAADFKAKGSVRGNQTAGGGAPSAAAAPTMEQFQPMVQQAQQMHQQAVQPQVEALEAQKPDVEQRYQDLIADITKTGRAAKTSEYARRGVPISSGQMEHELGQQLAGPIAQAGQARSGELQNLAMTIAKLRGGGMESAIQTALSMMGMQTSAQQSQAQLAMQKWAGEEATRRAEISPTTDWQKEMHGIEWPYQQQLVEAQIARQKQLAAGGGVGGGPEPTELDPFKLFGGQRIAQSLGAGMSAGRV